MTTGTEKSRNLLENIDAVGCYLGISQLKSGRSSLSWRLVLALTEPIKRFKGHDHLSSSKHPIGRDRKDRDSKRSGLIFANSSHEQQHKKPYCACCALTSANLESRRKRYVGLWCVRKRLPKYGLNMDFNRNRSESRSSNHPSKRAVFSLQSGSCWSRSTRYWRVDNQVRSRTNAGELWIWISRSSSGTMAPVRHPCFNVTSCQMNRKFRWKLQTSMKIFNVSNKPKIYCDEKLEKTKI